MDHSNIHIIELNDEDTLIDTSLLTLRTISTHKGVSKAKILYDKKKLALKFGSEYEIKRCDKHMQLKIFLTPAEEKNLEVIEKKIKKMMGSKLKQHEIIDSLNEAYEYFQSNILSDHETNVFICKIEDNALNASNASNTRQQQMNHTLSPVDVRFKPGKSMLIGYNVLENPCQMSDKNDNNEEESLATLISSAPVEGEDEEEGKGGEEKDEEEEEEKEEKLEENKKEEEDSKMQKDAETIDRDASKIINTSDSVDFDISLEYTDCIRSARNALVGLKTKEQDIKRALAKYVHFAGSYLPYTKNDDRQTFSKKHKEKYMTYKAELLSHF